MHMLAPPRRTATGAVVVTAVQQDGRRSVHADAAPGASAGSLLRRLVLSGFGAAALLAAVALPLRPATAEPFGLGGPAALQTRPAFLEDKASAFPPSCCFRNH